MGVRLSHSSLYFSQPTKRQIKIIIASIQKYFASMRSAAKFRPHPGQPLAVGESIVPQSRHGTCSITQSPTSFADGGHVIIIGQYRFNSSLPEVKQQIGRRSHFEPQMIPHQSRFSMNDGQSAVPQKESPDPSAWIDPHGDYLFRYAMFRLRNASVAEDLVQETLLAALQAYGSFAGRGSERTWLVGILKHKITDYFRRLSRETPASQVEGEAFEHEECFRPTGQWKHHWEPEQAPIEWQTSPAEMLEQHEFWEVFQQCLSPLPMRIASAFTLREVDGLSSEEICDVLSITVNNLWVMLHRARMHLRHCIEVKWFRQEPAGH